MNASILFQVTDNNGYTYAVATVATKNGNCIFTDVCKPAKAFNVTKQLCGNVCRCFYSKDDKKFYLERKDLDR